MISQIGLIAINRSNWPNGLAVGPPNEINQHSVEQVTHVVLFLARSTLAETFNEQDRLEHPEVWFRVKTCVRKYFAIFKLAMIAVRNT